MGARRDGIIFYERLPRHEEIARVDASAITLNDGSSLRIHKILASRGSSEVVGSLGDRLFTCGINSQDDMTSIGTGLVDDEALSTALTVPPPAYCTGAIRISRDRIAIALVDELVIFDERGELVSRTSVEEQLPGLSTSVEVVSTGPGGRATVISRNSEYFHRNALSAPFQ